MTQAGPAYRPGVGIVLFNASGKVFLGLRSDGTQAWQLPQGGIERGEEPRAAALRELEEEIGTAAAEILAETDWLAYDLPAELRSRLWGGRYRGQRQKWFAMRFLGADTDIDLAKHTREFSQWRWGELADLPVLAVGFKQPVYRALAEQFGRFANPSSRPAQ
jgi:putative (di)nucleoside polyphosphate hydrolase